MQRYGSRLEAGYGYCIGFGRRERRLTASVISRRYASGRLKSSRTLKIQIIPEMDLPRTQMSRFPAIARRLTSRLMPRRFHATGGLQSSIIHARRAYGILALGRASQSGAVVPTACKSVLMESRFAVGFQLERQPRFRRDWSIIRFGHVVCRGSFRYEH